MNNKGFKEIAKAVKIVNFYDNCFVCRPLVYASVGKKQKCSHFHAADCLY